MKQFEHKRKTKTKITTKNPPHKSDQNQAQNSPETRGCCALVCSWLSDNEASPIDVHETMHKKLEATSRLLDFRSSICNKCSSSVRHQNTPSQCQKYQPSRLVGNLVSRTCLVKSTLSLKVCVSGIQRKYCSAACFVWGGGGRRGGVFFGLRINLEKASHLNLVQPNAVQGVCPPPPPERASQL